MLSVPHSFIGDTEPRVQKTTERSLSGAVVAMLNI